jgi:hypothetical protein
MAVLLAALVAAVVTYCLARAFVPALHDPAHARDVDLWHVVMGAGMVAMLLLTLTRAAAALGLVVFVVGLCWSAFRLATPGARSAYLRLGVGCAAMTVMLLPTATAGAAALPAHHHDHAAGGAGVTAVVPPTALLMALLAGVGAILLVRLGGSLRRSVALPGRLAACCDVAMAAAMGTMLVAML